MANQDTPIRLILLQSHVEHGEIISSALRNGGFAVRLSRANDIDELTTQLESNTTDIVLAAYQHPHCTLEQVSAALRASPSDAVLIATHDSVDEDIHAAIYQHGACQLINLKRPAQALAATRWAMVHLSELRSSRRLALALRESERRCDALIDSSRDPIAYVHEGMHIRANQAYLEMFGYDDLEVLEGIAVLDLIDDRDADAFRSVLKKLARGEPPPSSLALRATRADGEVFDAVMEFANASYEGEACQQIVFRRNETPKLNDPVTGLLSRTQFMSLLDAALARGLKGAQNEAALLLEIDNFGVVLNEIGLNHADELLRDLSDLLRNQLTDGAEMARLSDHSFGLHLVNSDFAQTREFAELLRAKVQGHIIEVGKRSLTLTLSIGGVQIGPKSVDVATALGKASQCLQIALSEGGNRSQLFDPSADDHEEAARIKAWVERIQSALKSNEFLLYYQPISSLQGETGEFYETLLRMKGSDGEIVPPLTFLPIAEDHGLIEKIDRWVLSHAIAALAKRNETGTRTRLLVKLTPQSMLDPSLPTWIGNLLKTSGVGGDQLVFGIAESRVATQLKAAQDFLRKVASLGCAMCIEQFGTSGNSFDLLKHLDASMLKIDRRFTEDLGRNVENQRRVKAIAERARAQEKLTIAEFVQDAASMSVLFTSAVSFVEGNFLAAPGTEMNYEF
ncbi:MAG: EAL domain-containing protein [Lysobacteraceae bacterium]